MQLSKLERLFHTKDEDYRLVTSGFISPQALFWMRLVLAFYAATASVVDTIVNVAIYKKPAEK